ncbi:MAG: M20 family metallopeptidase [Deltaproteobacteria bacterium]|nr:M20 family metallopeptidase [Deltaproteobacteria bacterium]
MDLLAEIKNLAEVEAAEVTSLRREFHRHPELSHHEERTARVVAEYLAGLGLEVRTGIAGYGVVGRLRASRAGKSVAYRADMDALPVTEKVESPWRSQTTGVMHACGHDFHMSIALGAARLLTKLKDRLAGEYRFIFQPAEEGPPKGDASGALGMLKAGVLENPSVAAVFGLHVAPSLDVGHVRYCPDVVMAGSDHLVLTVQGKAAHGATPYRGVDAVLVSAHALTQIKALLTQEVDTRNPVVLSFGRISGGNRFNILAERVELEGSLRYLKESVREQVLAILRRHLAGLAKASGAKIGLATKSIYPILKNDPRLTGQAVEILGRVLGAKRVKTHLPAMGSEDFAYFAQKVPAFYFFLGVRTPGTRGQALHSPDFNPDEAALPYGLKAAAALLAVTAGSE